MEEFEKELINRHSLENGSNTPDFILARFLVSCLQAWNEAVSCRELWYDRGEITWNPHGVMTSPQTLAEDL